MCWSFATRVTKSGFCLLSESSGFIASGTVGEDECHMGSGAQLLAPGSPKGAGEERIYPEGHSQLLPPPAFWSLSPPNDAPRSQLGQWMTLVEQLRALLV